MSRPAGAAGAAEYRAALLSHAALPASRPGRGRLLFGETAASDLRAPPPEPPQSGCYALPVAGAPQLLSRRTLPLPQLELAAAPRTGSRAGAERLWIYNLHYFDDLNARGRAGTARVARAPARALGRREPSRPTARAGSPIRSRCASSTGSSGALLGQALPPECRDQPRGAGALARQRLGVPSARQPPVRQRQGAGARRAVLRRRRRPTRLVRAGCASLARELPEQILADGGHFERSPMYHALVLEDAARPRQPAAALWPAAPASVAASSRRACALARRDDAPGRRASRSSTTPPSGSRPRSELDAYAARLGLGAVAVPAAPLAVLRRVATCVWRPVGACCCVDCAPVGPGLPARPCARGHA